MINNVTVLQMIIAKPPIVINEDYIPDAMKNTRGYLHGDFKYMPSQNERIKVSLNYF